MVSRTSVRSGLCDPEKPEWWLGKNFPFICGICSLTVCFFFLSSQNHFAPSTDQQSLANLKIEDLTPLTPEVISKQATINIGTIGHVAHGKSTVVKAISGVQTVRFKNELERNITIKLGNYIESAGF